MKRSPFYLLIALISCGYLAAANQRGWNPLVMLSAPYYAAKGASARHK